jgi:uncharacterized protein (TIGR03083 family)
MSLSLDRSLEAISTHSHGLADAARRNLSAPVEHCPGWTMADLVWHVAEVHWFWRTVAGELLSGPPDESRRPEREADEALIAAFLAGAADLVDTLRAADQSAPCWTWFPPRQDIGFITRHQVQEVAVHHWDAANAAGQPISIDTDVAADAVEEFLTCSLADADDVAQLGRTLRGSLTLLATDAGKSWTVSQASPSAALSWAPGESEPTVSGTAEELLLWLYQRVPLPATDEAVVAAFRKLSSTD